ncbi:hypothetical protein [Natribacillus halophilus]|uniref:Uncharacterized protein n=1 Tax=Natribacillus halophilus TaxID=549003 RepID=A0A1G8RUH2_9BACI|nr:hypothetical protein [Natribacillus halophilus]SDJ20724.1 hypothetical protein SAMN04488123_12059 [Natribacillus halophilus]
MNKIKDLLTEIEAKNIYVGDDGKYTIMTSPERMKELPITYHEKPSHIVPTTKYMISEHESFSIVAVSIDEGVIA